MVVECCWSLVDFQGLLMWYVIVNDHSQTLVHLMVFYVLDSEPMWTYEDFYDC